MNFSLVKDAIKVAKAQYNDLPGVLYIGIQQIHSEYKIIFCVDGNKFGFGTLSSIPGIPNSIKMNNFSIPFVFEGIEPISLS